MNKNYKKVGDLVKWSIHARSWSASWPDEPKAEFRNRGVIFDENSKYYFVHWENGERIAELCQNLEVIEKCSD